MKLRILLLTFLASLLTLQTFSQGSNCNTADPFCTGTTYTFPNSTSTADLGTINCCSTTPNPAWYYMQLDVGGNMTIHIDQTDASGTGIDVDFVLFGPYSSLPTACATIPGGPVEDCSYSAAASEDADITGGIVGEFYVLLLTNYSDQPGTITFSQTGGTASANCSLLCGVTGFTATPGACNPATNQYSVSGTLSITSPPASGTVTFTNSCGGAPVVVSSPFPASIPYSFSGLTSTGGSCTISSSFSADATCNSTVNYTAPAPCTTSCSLSVTATPGACNPATNQYTLNGNLTFSSPPATGTLTVTNSCGGSQVFSAPFASPLAYSITGLNSSGSGCNVTASFSATPACSASVSYTAPVPCTTSCVINNFTANLTAPTCGSTGGTYDISGVVQTSSAPATGTLTVSTTCGGSQVFNAPFASTINYTLTGLNASGASCTITAVYSAAPGCTQSIPYTAPSCPCNMDSLVVNIGVCNTTTNTYTVDVHLVFSSPPSSGTLDVDVCGTVQHLNAPFISPLDLTFSGLPTGVGACTVNASFSSSPACSNSISYVAPSDCNCPADAGTFTTTITGSGTTNYILCDGDQIDITSNGDYTPPAVYNDPSDPSPPTYAPGLWVLIYSCPPSVYAPADLTTDPCLLGVSPFTDDFGNMTDINDMFIINSYPAGTFTNNTVYYVPITMYDVTTGTFSYYVAPNLCYSMGTPIAVTYLPPIVANGVENCAATTVTVTVSGGHPQIFGSQFTASGLLPATASFVNTSCGNGGTITITGLANGDNYSFDITDNNGCPYHFTGGPFTGPVTATLTPAGPFCSSDPAVNLTASIAGGTWSGTGITNASAGTFDPSVAGTGTWTITYLPPGCANSSTMNITVGNITIASVDTIGVTCFGASDGQMTVNCAAASQFSIDGGTTYSASNVFTGLAPGTYNIAVKSPSGCSATTTAVINEPPQLQLGINTFANETCLGACNGQVAALPTGGTIPYSSVSWTGPVTGSGLTLSNACSGTYTASVTDAHGCAASNTTVVTGPPPPPVTFTADTTQGCLPVLVNFTNTMAAGLSASCTWDFGDGGTSTNCNPLHVYNTAGCYDVTLSVTTTTGCHVDTTFTNYICVFNNPVADFGSAPQPADVFNPLVTFSNLSIGGNSYSWDFAGMGTSTAINPQFLFPSDSGGVYNVCLSTVNNQGCVDTTCHLVVVQSVFLLYVPNSFTPDANGANDIFLPILQGEDPLTYELYIFDRWGEIIFQSNNKLIGWDGTHNGIKCKEDVYVWKIKVRKDFNQGKVERIGHVSLLR